MTRVVATWFYEQERAEGGAYAQVSGDSSTQEFRDVYRRCLAVFFATARRVVPDARLVVYLNKGWDPSASRVSSEVYGVLERLGVERQVLPYTFAPPPRWPAGWRNQFFVFDALRALGRSSDESDPAVLLDSDIVWSGAAAGEAMWDQIGERGALTYRVGYGPDHPINGCSRRRLTELAQRLGIESNGVVDYSGGEFVAARADVCLGLVAKAEELWPGVLERHERGEITQIEEAHLLSLCYSALRIEQGTGDPFVKRLWTQPFKHRNVTPEDLDLPLWHVPAEKKYGLRQLYPHTLRPDSSLWSCPDDAYRRRLGRALGVPANTRVKVAADVTRAVAQRIRRAGPSRRRGASPRGRDTTRRSR
ncbi:MAG TPA: hypothetical protein VGK78_08870 [Nocardioides sp.]|uniref:hypothetical protein n=1 Tax=Nocardioides sp. TaxID=35761 RepID=UPI002F3F53B8